MTRIASAASNTQLLNILFDVQQRVQEQQVQVVSEKKSETYTGLALETERLVNIENTVALLNRFSDNNTIKDIELKVFETTVEGMRKTINEFREQILLFESGSLDVEVRVKAVQDAAFRAMKDMEIFLNTDINGEHLFSGTRVTTAPVNLNLSNITAFQTKYDGANVLYPVTRDSQLANFSTTNADTGNLTFTAGPPGQITAGTVGSLATIPVGSTITVAGSNVAGNNTTFTVIRNTGTTLDISGTIANDANGVTGITSTVTSASTVAADVATAATITATSFYAGDSNSQKHRVSKDRDFTQTLNAIDPSFEKSLRAMAIIAQGAFGTTGGLDQNTGRVTDALFLLNSSLDRTTPGAPQPFGTEKSENITETANTIGFQRVLIDRTNKTNESLIGFFEARISDTENIDKLEAVSLLLDNQQALEASFQALARIRDLTLTDFLR